MLPRSGIQVNGHFENFVVLLKLSLSLSLSSLVHREHTHKTIY